MIALSRTPEPVVAAEFEQSRHGVGIERRRQALARLRRLHVGAGSRSSSPSRIR